MSTSGGLTTVDPRIPSGATVLEQQSGNVANAAAVAVFGAVAGQTNWVTGFEVTAAGATAASVVLVTLTGGLVTFTYVFVFPAGATVQAQPLIVEFTQPRPANNPNVALTLTLPAGGAGNTNAAVVMHGFRI